MEDTSPLRRLAGGGLVAGAVGFALAGALHPESSALATMLLLATTVWLLVDAAVTRGSAAAQLGARLTIVGERVPRHRSFRRGGPSACPPRSTGS